VAEALLSLAFGPDPGVKACSWAITEKENIKSLLDAPQNPGYSIPLCAAICAAWFRLFAVYPRRDPFAVMVDHVSQPQAPAERDNRSHSTVSLAFTRLRLLLEVCVSSGPARLREGDSGSGAAGGGYG
jgi:hypothetical protein